MQENEKVAIVTGAARGIGQAIAHELAAQGMTVIVTDIVEESGEACAREMRDEGLRAHFKQVDVSDQDNVKAAVKEMQDEFGKVDVLVNNAGIRPTRPFAEMTYADWQKVLKVNLDGTYFFCSAVLPLMKASGWGRIINISSLAAQQGSTGGHSHYAASKAGVMGLSKSLAREYAPFGITVNVIAPGWIDTEGWGGALDGRRDEFAARVPARRLGTPQDVAAGAAFLASEDASYVTGITLPINGGLYIS